MTTTIKKVTLKSLKGGNTHVDFSKGTVSNPFTQEEYQTLRQTGTWPGGYVEAMGYVAPPMMDGGDDGSSGSGSEPEPQYNTIVSIANSYKDISGTNGFNTIKKWLMDVGVKEDLIQLKNGDVTPAWCAAFVSAVYREAGVVDKKYSMASQWTSWGSETNTPQQGDLAIISTSHVGIYVGPTISPTTVQLISGNWSGKVQFHHYNKSWLTFRTKQ